MVHFTKVGRITWLFAVRLAAGSGLGHDMKGQLKNLDSTGSGRLPLKVPGDAQAAKRLSFQGL